MAGGLNTGPYTGICVRCGDDEEYIWGYLCCMKCELFFCLKCLDKYKRSRTICIGYSMTKGVKK